MVILKGVKVIKKHDEGSEDLFYLVGFFFFSYVQVFPQPYLITAVFLQQLNLFFAVNTENLARSLT